MLRNTNNSHQFNNKSKQSRFLTSLEVKKLLTACDTTTNRGKRDLALLEILLYLGLRVSELVMLSPEDITRHADSFIIIASKGTSRNRFLHVPDNVSITLNIWLEVIGQFEGKAHDKIFFQILKSDKLSERSISTQQVRNIVTGYGYRSGLSPRKGKNRLLPTDLRRTCGRNAYDNGARLLDVQALLGDTRPLSTARFIDVLKNQNPAKAVDFIKY